MISKVFKVAKTTLSRSETEPTRPLRLNQPNPLSSVALKAQWPAAHRTAIPCSYPTSHANLNKKTSKPTFQAQNSPQRPFSPTPSTPKETMFKQRTKFRQETRQPWCPASTIFAGWRQSVLPVHLLGLAPLLGSVGPVAGDVKLQDDGVMDHPVNRRGGGHGVGKDALPLREDQV